MALEDYNSLLIEHLEELQAAAELTDGDEVVIWLGVLREKHFDEDSLALAQEFADAGQFDSLLQWAGERLAELRSEEDPFADGFDFDVDDAFLDLEDTGFRAPSEQVMDVDPDELLGNLDDLAGGAIELLEDESLAPRSEIVELEDFDGSSAAEDVDSEYVEDVADVADVEDVDAVAAHVEGDVAVGSRPHVLSGKFTLLDRSKIEADRETRSLSDSLDDVMRQVNEDEAPDPDRQTRPNATPDLAAIRSDAERAAAEGAPFDSGSSQARYAPEVQAADEADSEEAAAAAPEASDAEAAEASDVEASDSEASGGPHLSSEDFAAALGFGDEDSDEAEEEVPAASAPLQLEPAAGFDFGFDDFAADEISDVDNDVEEPDKPKKSDAAQTRPGPPEEEEETAERDRAMTPLKPLPAQDPEDMFFEMASALAADSSDAGFYRGEPIGSQHSAATNPFGNDMPTGTAHMPLAAGAMSAEQSHVQTNLNAILLEARRLRTAGELEAALDITKKVLSRDSNGEAEELRDQIESELEVTRTERLGDLDRTPKLALGMGALAGLDLDHRAGYIISQVDGMMTFEDLIELSGMSRVETLAVFVALLDQGVIEA